MAKVVFKRTQTNAEIDNIPILDGQLIYSGEGKSYIDYGTNRVPINGTPDSSISSSSTNPVENHVIKEYVDTQINNILTPNFTILWTNSNPTQPFAQQNITLQQNNCDVLIWICERTSNNSSILISEQSLKGYGTMITSVASDGETLRRGIIYSSGETYVVQSGAKGASVQADEYLVPLYVVGYNTGLFE